jgi:hypothetical protein
VTATLTALAMPVSLPVSTSRGPAVSWMMAALTPALAALIWSRTAVRLVPSAIVIGTALVPRVMVRVPAPMLLASVIAPAAVERDCAVARPSTSML